MIGCRSQVQAWSEPSPNYFNYYISRINMHVFWEREREKSNSVGNWLVGRRSTAIHVSETKDYYFEGFSG